MLQNGFKGTNLALRDRLSASRDRFLDLGGILLGVDKNGLHAEDELRTVLAHLLLNLVQRTPGDVLNRDCAVIRRYLHRSQVALRRRRRSRQQLARLQFQLHQPETAQTPGRRADELVVDLERRPKVAVGDGEVLPRLVSLGLGDDALCADAVQLTLELYFFVLGGFELMLELFILVLELALELFFLALGAFELALEVLLLALELTSEVFFRALGAFKLTLKGYLELTLDVFFLALGAFVLALEVDLGGFKSNLCHREFLVRGCKLSAQVVEFNGGLGA